MHQWWGEKPNFFYISFLHDNKSSQKNFWLRQRSLKAFFNYPIIRCLRLYFFFYAIIHVLSTRVPSNTHSMMWCHQMDNVVQYRMSLDAALSTEYCRRCGVKRHPILGDIAHLVQAVVFCKRLVTDISINGVDCAHWLFKQLPPFQPISDAQPYTFDFRSILLLFNVTPTA